MKKTFLELVEECSGNPCNSEAYKEIEERLRDIQNLFVIYSDVVENNGQNNLKHISDQIFEKLK